MNTAPPPAFIVGRREDTRDLCGVARHTYPPRAQGVTLFTRHQDR